MRDLTLIKSFDDRRISLVWQKLLADPNLKVAELAKCVGLSESRLQHLFIQYVGLTIREIKYRMRRNRLHVAHRQLLETTDTILEIRERAGYAHESNFRRDFKNLFQRSPAVYRRGTE